MYHVDTRPYRLSPLSSVVERVTRNSSPSITVNDEVGCSIQPAGMSLFLFCIIWEYVHTNFGALLLRRALEAARLAQW